MLEPCAGKLARTVLRGPGAGNSLWLPDHSEPGKGSDFKVFLPVASTGLMQGEKNESVLPEGTERILFVDDEPDIIEVGRLILKKLGYHVATANNALEALDMFRSRPDGFDLVISDMTMPKMTGDRFAKELISIRADLPVILCTGFTTGLTKEKAKAIGIKGFLMKPIIFEEFANLIRQVLDEAKKKT